MVAEIIIIIAAMAFLLLSFGFFAGKGSWLIAGYNTAPPEEKAKYEEKELCRAAGFICFIVSVLLFIMACLGYCVDSGLMPENAMLTFAFAFAAIVLTTVFWAIRYMNTRGKKR